MENIIAFIPARSGSKSIEDKNIKELGGKPLIAWSIELAKRCNLRTVVSTDSEKYAGIAERYGAEVLQRPKELSQDKTSTFEVLKSEVGKIEPKPEYIMLLQPTSPFREKIHVRMAISYLLANPDRDSIISVERIPEKYNPAQVIVNSKNGPVMANYAKVKDRITRRQDFPEAWTPTGSIYMFKTKNLEGGSFYGEKVMLLETEPTININSENDWSEAERLLNKR